MWATYRRLNAELDGGTIDGHRLLEIETIIRLLLPHLTRAVAESVHRLSERPELRHASSSLIGIRGCLDSVEVERDTASLRQTQNRLAEAVEYAREILADLEGLAERH